jgi:fumarate hydratase subunit beta
MKNSICITTPLTDDICKSLKVGDFVLLSGEIFTARDVAHRRLVEASLKGDKQPFDLKGKVLFYAAPTPTRPGKIIGSIGPTTSSRMDPFTPELLKIGLKGMIGKGKRSQEVISAIRQHGAVYFGAPGGIAALMARCVKKSELMTYEDLGPEAILRLEVADMPLVVLVDSEGNDLYEKIRTMLTGLTKTQILE